MTNKASALPSSPGSPLDERLAALGDRLFERRRQLQLSQQELADRAGLRRDRLSRLENGHFSPTLPEACTLAAVLGISLDHLILGIRDTRVELPAEELLPPLVEIAHLGTAEDLGILNRFLQMLAVGLRNAAKGTARTPE